ncbi:MAG: response regulator [Firmicutes bacterium]|nr:response regulator [Bacillota bacterium]
MINVLIVEDDPMVSELNKRYVESIEGFKVIKSVSNGQDALKILNKKRIDLVILDIYMPKVDGISLLKEMRKRSIMSDVILVTAAKEAKNIDAVLKLGAVDYLIKPFEFERLQNSLKKYLQRHRLLNDKEAFKQEDIDKLTVKYKTNGKEEIKKGLHKHTLDMIRRYMSKNKDIYLSSDEIAEKLDFSKVTIRRYLEYLEEIGEIKLQINYGGIGRPAHLYKYNKK